MNISLHFLYKTLGTAYLSRAIFLVCKFCSIPLFLLHLSKEEYAVFALLSGLEGWFLLLDFGMGPSLQNAIAAQNKEKGNIYKTASIYHKNYKSIFGLQSFHFL
jgi:O-antigen/teichoic acid export membrane protein